MDTDFNGKFHIVFLSEGKGYFGDWAIVADARAFCHCCYMRDGPVWKCG